MIAHFKLNLRLQIQIFLSDWLYNSCCGVRQPSLSLRGVKRNECDWNT